MRVRGGGGVKGEGQVGPGVRADAVDIASVNYEAGGGGQGVSVDHQS